MLRLFDKLLESITKAIELQIILSSTTLLPFQRMSSHYQTSRVRSHDSSSPRCRVKIKPLLMISLKDLFFGQKTCKI